MVEIKVPSLGESVSEATVAKWLKKEGETVKLDEPLVELETDKVTLEVNAPQDGVLSSIAVAEGEDVAMGTVLGHIEAGASGTGTKPAEAPTVAKKEEPVKAEKAPEKDSGKSSGEGQPLSPAARKHAEDNKVDASKIDGTGKDGRVTKGDVLAHVESGGKPATPPKAVAPAAPRETGPREERVKMTRLRQRIAERLKDAQNTAAMLTTFNEVDMSAIMEARNTFKDSFEKKHGVKLGFMSFFVKACVNALKEFPSVNAEINGTDIIYKNYYDISVAVSTPQGLIVPVVRDCDTKSMAQIEKDIGDVGKRAREGNLSVDELSGGTFTITNGGIFGSLCSTPILNAPQTGILGMHKIQQRPVVLDDGSIVARPMMYLAMSYDHRIIDGKEAVSFLVRVKDALEAPQRLLLEI